MLSFSPKNVSKEMLSELPDRSRRVLSDRFGLSGKGEEVMKWFGFTPENVVAKAKELLLTS